MTRPVLLALAALIVAGWVRRRKRTVHQSGEVNEYDTPVPMTWEPGVPGPEWFTFDTDTTVRPAWDGTATYDGNSHTVRIRWAPTTTEV